ncbi:hypothetical protein MRX96_021960 [Rhipicephalus microplus]
MQRNEVATIILTAFNYGDVCVVVRVSLTSLENLEIVSGPNSTDALLCPNATNSASFPFDVRATTLELSRLQARVQTRPEAQSEYPDVKLSNVNSSDTVIQTIDVRALPSFESITCMAFGFFLCSSPKGSPSERSTHTCFVRQVTRTLPRDTVQVTLPTPEALVEGSQRVVLVGTGDILALSLNDLSVPTITYSNAEGTLAVLAFKRLSPQVPRTDWHFDGHCELWTKISHSTSVSSSIQLPLLRWFIRIPREYLGANAAAEIDASVRYVTQQWNPLTGCFVENEPTASPYGPNTTPDLSAAVGVMLAESGLLQRQHHGRPERANTALQTLLGEADKSSGLTSWTGDGLASGSADTAGYAVLTSKLLGRNLGEALPIVRWLMQQTYARYTFSYSEVYTVAIQALTQYSSVAFSKNTDLSLTVAVESASPDNLSFQINEQNKLLYQERLLDKSDSYSLQASLAPNSVGCAALQVNTLQLDICTRYTEGFLRSSAIVEVTLLSGYSADDQSLKNLVSSGVIKRYVVNGNKVQLILQTLTIQPTCFSLTENRYLQVTNLQSSVVEVYDYYQYQYKATAGYGLEGNCTPAEVAPPTSLNEVDSVIYI